MDLTPHFTLPREHKLEPEFVRPYSQLTSSPSPASASEFLKAMRPVIDTGLKTFGGKAQGPLLRSHARRLTLDAARTYDPTKGPLRSHVMNNLKGLSRYAIRQQQMLSVPDAVAIDHLHLREAENELRDELGRDPSDDELADRTGMSPLRMAKIRRFRPGFTQSQAEATRDEEGGPGEVAVRGPDPAFHALEFIYPDLDHINKAIVDNHFGRNGRPRLSFTHIGRRLNLSPGAISQRVQYIQRAVDEIADAGLF